MAQNVLITGTGRPYALGFNLGNERDCPFRSLFSKAEPDEAQDHLQDGGAGGCQPHMEHGNRHLSAHQESHGDPDQKCPDDPLNHHEPRHPQSVEIADKAKQEAGQQAVNGIGFQVIGGSQNHLRIIGKNPRKQIALPESNGKHNHCQHG